jgi:hypothetical protein
MSYAIENLKFTIFGHGYDATRNDSGTGEVTDIHPFPNAIQYGAIDASGNYVWLSDGYNYLRKFDIKTWEEQVHSVPTGKVYHPSNVSNDYGVLILPSDQTKVFDLRTNEILNNIGNIPAVIPNGSHDSIVVDDVIYLVRFNSGQVNSPIVKVDLDNNQMSYTMLYNRTTMGFVDDDTIYDYYSIAWYNEHFAIYGTGLNGSDQWGATAIGEGQAGFPNVLLSVLCSNGKIYAPTNINGWKMGVYDGNSAPDFDTPTPIRTFGEFSAEPRFEWQSGSFNIVYNNGRTKCAFATTVGTYWTDFTSMYKLSDTPEVMIPLVISDKHIVCQNRTNNEVIVVGI